MDPKRRRDMHSIKIPLQDHRFVMKEAVTFYNIWFYFTFFNIATGAQLVIGVNVKNPIFFSFALKIASPRT